jgi:hypothetical protein
LLDYLSNNNSTTLHLFWADWGCGKSHTLRYMEHLCLTKYQTIFPLYARMPDNAKGFTEVYKTIVKSINFPQLFEMYRNLIGTKGEEYLLDKIFSGNDKFFNVFQSTLGTAENKSISKRWLCGERISTAELRTIGAFDNLKTNEDGIQVLEYISKLIIKCGKYARLLIMLDEYQLLHQKSDSIESKINSGLHKLYDSVSNNFSIILSFSFSKKKDVYLRLSGELQSREDPISISIPEMSPLEVTFFVMSLFQIYRTDNKPPSLLYPLKPNCIDVIVSDIKKKQKKINPREIINRLGLVLESCRKKAELGVEPEVSEEEVLQILSSINV